MSNYRQDPANTEREPAIQEETFTTTIDDKQDFPQEVEITFAYQTDGRKAIVDKDIEVTCGRGLVWDWAEQVEEEIVRRLNAEEITFK